jgi:hypothetical protein
MWFVKSSQNADELSLTFKSILAVIIPILAIFKIDASQFPQVLDLLVKVIEAVWTLVAAFGVFVGAVRKVHLTRLGRNEVIKRM